jgi:hypothetical protein
MVRLDQRHDMPQRPIRGPRGWIWWRIDRPQLPHPILEHRQAMGPADPLSDPRGARLSLGGPSPASARFTVFFEHPIAQATCLIGIRSARCSRRISAQSSTLNTSLPPRLGSSQVGEGSTFRRRLGVSFHCDDAGGGRGEGLTLDSAGWVPCS